MLRAKRGTERVPLRDSRLDGGLGAADAHVPCVFINLVVDALLLEKLRNVSYAVVLIPASHKDVLRAELGTHQVQRRLELIVIEVVGGQTVDNGQRHLRRIAVITGCDGQLEAVVIGISKVLGEHTGCDQLANPLLDQLGEGLRLADDREHREPHEDSVKLRH